MLNTIVSFVLYLFEMLIAYIVFSFASERKRNTFITFLIGFIIFEFGSVINLIGANTIWINSIYTVFSTLIFAVSCFNIKLISAAVYAVLMTIFSGAFEFATIFAVSAIAGAGVKDYNSDVSLLLMEISISKTLYLISCIALVYFPKNNSTIAKVPVSFFLLPICILFSLVSFWYISAHETLSHINQLLLSIISIVLLGSTVFLFITYRHNLERENEYIQMKSENDRLQVEKAYYDILERQNQQLMIYTHDTKNHLAAIQNLSTNPRINHYIEELLNQLGNYSNNCHSGNKTLDVIINKYVAKCDLLKISFDYDVKSCNLNSLEDIDLVSILGNLMDNALTAAETSTQKYISLETTSRNSYNVIIISNSCDNEPMSNGKHLVTTKEDHKLHGFGLKSVEKTLKKYHGDFNWDYDAEKQLFLATVMIGASKG